MFGFVQSISKRGPILSSGSALRIFTRNGALITSTQTLNPLFNGCLKGLNLGRSLLYSSSMEFRPGRNSRPMDFVRGTIEENRMDLLSKPSQPNTEVNADIVHITMIRNNTFVTVTDSKGNKKFGASSGSLSEMKGGPKLSRYAAEATAEHIGRLARRMGLKSVVMKVNGFSFFRKKRQAIMSFRDGYTNSRGDINPIVHIEDTTRLPHNGCRLRKKRRV